MSRNAARPLSPHLTIWKWGPHMLVSILHRATGSALAIGGTLMLLWWLAAIAGGPAYYDIFLGLMTKDETGALNLVPLVILVGLTWSFFQHLGTGVRHLVLDTGAGYELKTNKFWSIMTMVVSVSATAAIWASILLEA